MFHGIWDSANRDLRGGLPYVRVWGGPIHLHEPGRQQIYSYAVWDMAVNCKYYPASTGIFYGAPLHWAWHGGEHGLRRIYCGFPLLGNGRHCTPSNELGA